MESTLFEQISDNLRNDRDFALVTVIKALGSTPAKPGFRMVVFPDGKSMGSVGGGALEGNAIKDALNYLENDESGVLKEYSLETDLQMACGGQVTLFFETTVKYHLHLVGCGHVAQAVAPIATQAGFRVSVYDDRAEYMAQSSFPEKVSLYPGDLNETVSKIKGGHHSIGVVLTYDHTLDELGVKLLIEKGFGYLGLIGSNRKSIKIRKNLLNSGIDQELIDKLRCPLGMPIGGDTPFEIALSIVGELVAFKSGKPFQDW
jgi:xanthine dehydrogenase accessory factor